MFEVGARIAMLVVGDIDVAAPLLRSATAAHRAIVPRRPFTDYAILQQPIGDAFM